MICSRCLHRASSATLRSLRKPLPTTNLIFPRFLTTTPATSLPPSPSQPFSTPLSPTPTEAALGAHLKPKLPNANLPVSSCPAGTTLKGINYLKARDDPVALGEEEYPAWLWRCLDAKVTDGDAGEGNDDMFSKSKKLRRKAAKQARKHEAARLAAGDTSVFEVKVPITQQSIDLPANEEGTISGAVEADRRREELTSALRRERRAKIKEDNFLKGI